MKVYIVIAEFESAEGEWQESTNHAYPVNTPEVI